MMFLGMAHFMDFYKGISWNDWRRNNRANSLLSSGYGCLLCLPNFILLSQHYDEVIVCALCQDCLLTLLMRSVRSMMIRLLNRSAKISEDFSIRFNQPLQSISVYLLVMRLVTIRLLNRSAKISEDFSIRFNQPLQSISVYLLW